MKKIFPVLVVILILSSFNACSLKDNTQTDVKYISVGQLYSKADSLANMTINVEGEVEKVCLNTYKRFKIIDKTSKYEIKIELGGDFPKVDTSIIGKTAKVTGKLTPVQMDADMVLEWEEKMKETHKGEENTQHYKDELAEIQNIYNEICSGTIPYYTSYTIKAESYIIE